MNFYPGYTNQYFNGQIQPQMSRMSVMDQQYPQYTPPQPITNPYKQQIGLQGKSVDSLDVVKAMDIPLDGSISYFPLTDGTAIITKQLQVDGTSRTIIYKPTEVEGSEKLPKYVTSEELDERIKTVDTKEEIKTLKKQIKDLSNNLRDLAEDIKDRKDE